MNNLYNNNDLKIIKKKINIYLITTIIMSLIFVIFNLLMILFSKYENYKLLKIITLIIDSLLIFITITIIVAFLHPFINLKDHYNNVFLDNGMECVAKIIRIRQEQMTLSKNLKVYEITIFVDENEKIVYLNSIFDVNYLKEEKKYEFVLSNLFIKQYKEINDGNEKD